jgi:bifunctional DNase/RNase
MLVSVKVHGLGLDKTNKTPVVMLQETEGDRTLPIWIGPSEASAIAVRLKEMTFERPMTHDLLAAVISGFGGHLTEVVIDHDGGNMYLAELVVHKDDKVLRFDARPSDAIAVALRLNAHILVYERILKPPASDDGAGTD